MDNKRRTEDWKTISESGVRSAIEELGILYRALSREELGSFKRTCCMDDHRNQTGSCACIERMKLMKTSANLDDQINYAIICDEIAMWFHAAGVLENQFLNKEIGPSKFRAAFRRCISLIRSDTGAYTRMIDLSILPSANVTDGQQTQEEEWECLDVYENFVISESTLCLNSVLHLWRIIAGGDFIGNDGTDQFREWFSLNYTAVLRWCAKVQEDVSTQVRKQRLFYSRVEDFLDAKKHRVKVKFVKAQETFQQKFKLGKSIRELKHWKKRQVNFWARWNFGSIHILQSNSEMLYNPDTNRLANNLGMRISHVSGSTISALYELALALEKTPHKWRRVSRDKKLLYYPFENCHDVTSALQVHFSTLGRGSLTEPVKQLLADKDYLSRVVKADRELKAIFLEMLNKGRERQQAYTEVGFQPSVLMSKIHHPQLAHWDYKNEDGRRDDYYIAFLALTKTGQFLQVWEYDNTQSLTEPVDGQVVFLPRSEMLMVKGDVLHAGGFRAETRADDRGAHMRFHFYVYPGRNSCMIQKHTNVYRDDNKADLSDIYVQNKILAGSIREGGSGNENLAWTFFQGTRPINPSTGVEQKQKRKSSRATRKE